MQEFERDGLCYKIQKLDYGDYQLEGDHRISIDRKQNLLEICQNVCQDHARFVREIERAVADGSQLIILCEHGGKIRTIQDVLLWQNPRLRVSPLAVSGERLFRIMRAMEHHYGIKWEFCSKSETGKRIIELLGVDADGTDGTAKRIVERSMEASQGIL